MTYYTVSDPITTTYTVTVGATTYYISPSLSIRTWLSLANQGLKTWKILKQLGLTTWKRLGAADFVSIYYLVPEPSTTVYVVPSPSTTYYEVSI